MVNHSTITVSIITVCYNSAPTLETTIQSVIYQNYPNIEYIVIDGGSNDGTVEILQKYQDHISYWLSEPDNGIYDAMNKGLSKATGDIIGILNSDDWYYDPTVIQRTAEQYVLHSGILYGDVIMADKQGTPYLHFRPSMNERDIWRQMWLCHPAVFVPKQVYKDFGGFDTRYRIAADYELMLRFYINKVSFHYLNAPVAYMRNGGISEQQSIMGFEEVRQISVRYGYSKTKAYFWSCYKAVKFHLFCFFQKAGMGKIIDWKRRLSKRTDYV